MPDPLNTANTVLDERELEELAEDVERRFKLATVNQSHGDRGAGYRGGGYGNGNGYNKDRGAYDRGRNYGRDREWR